MQGVDEHRAARLAGVALGMAYCIALSITIHTTMSLHPLLVSQC